MKNSFFLTHIHQPLSFNRIYWTCSLVLLPCLIHAGWLNSELAGKLLILFTTILAQELFFYFTRLTPACWSFSLLTGIYLSFLLPFNLPPLAFMLTPVFSLGLGRYIFGLSAYWLNPALTGFLFAFSLWPQNWLQLLPSLEHTGLLNAYLSVYALDQKTTFLANLINHSPLFERLFINVPSAYISLLEGQLIYNFISPLWLYLALIILWRRYIIKWGLSLAFFVSYFFLVYIFEGTLFGQRDYFCGDLFFYFLSPITLLSIFFLSTDNQATPLNLIDMLIQGLLYGIFSFLILSIWSSPWSIIFGVILGQICCPLFELHKISHHLARKKMERCVNLASYSQSNKDGES